MNYTRLALAAVVATIVDIGYGYPVYGVMLSGEFAKYPGLFRPMEAVNGNLPFMFLGTLLAMFAVAYIYAKGYEGGAGAQEGMRLGLLIGVFSVGYIAIGNYAVMNIGRRLTGEMAIAGFVEWVVVGIAIGLVYKPVAGGATAQVRRN